MTATWGHRKARAISRRKKRRYYLDPPKFIDRVMSWRKMYPDRAALLDRRNVKLARVRRHEQRKQHAATTFRLTTHRDPV
jgi:hypothetical protein